MGRTVKPTVAPRYSPLMHESAVIHEKKIFALDEKGNGLLYIPSESIWKTRNSDTSELRKGWHVIDNVIYGCVTGGWILWCEASELESGVMKWRQVMGLEDLRDTLCASKLVNYGWGLPSEHLDAMLPGPTCYSSGTVLLIGNARFGVQRSPYRGGRKQARFGQLLSGLKQSQLSIVLYISILIITVKFYILYPSIFEISTLFKVSNMYALLLLSPIYQ